MLRPVFYFLGCLLLVACDAGKTQLQQIQERGELRVVTRQGPTTYYVGPQGAAGFEYDLAKMFADYLGVKLDLSVASNTNESLKSVIDNKADLAAAGLAVTNSRALQVRFGPSYQFITQQLVYRKSSGKRPVSLTGLHDATLEVEAYSNHAENLRALHREHPQLTWNENQNLETSELMGLVNDSLIDYTVADSNEVALNQRFFPELSVAFDLTQPQPLAWAFSYAFDYSLHDAAYRFFNEIRDNGELDRLIERYYGHADYLNYGRWQLFMTHVNSRLGQYQAMFELAGQDTNIDWRLLAAMSYQESLWNPDARSATGVEGLMMLTRSTAQELGVGTRTDAWQSVYGGSRYMEQLLKQLPAEIEEPDRTWFALAAYNVGIGHLEDARNLTRVRGDNPNLWTHVKETLPLLRDKKWYMKVPFGYARGDEAVTYVQTIRAYYDLLVWMSDRKIVMGQLDVANPAL